MVILFEIQYIHLPDSINHVFMWIHFKRQITVTVAMRTVAIPNLDIKFWTRKSEFLQGYFLRSLTQPEITRQRLFGLMYIEYDQIKY